MKHCVIIGSGLGGLSCGCILAKNGYKVTILEQERQIGGCLQCFQRAGVSFDTGMHYIGSAELGQTLHTLLQYLNVDHKISLSRLEPKGYDVISYQGHHYQLANGREAFVNTLAQDFPKHREELYRYFDTVNLVAQSSAMHSLNRQADLRIHAEYQTRSTGEVIQSIVGNPILREVLAGITPLYAGEKDHTPFATHALISDFYNQSAFRIVGGSSTLADALAENIGQMGGKVLTQQKVVRIECNQQKATAVITEHGERYEADLIVSAIHPTNTMKLIESHLLRPAYRNRINSLRNTTGAFTVYLKFKKNSLPYMNRNLFCYRNKSVWGCEHYNNSTWPKYFLYMHFCQEEQPKWAETGEILTYMTFDEVKQWTGTTTGRRGEDYEQFKRKKAETLIQALSEEIPGIKEHIEKYYTSTPLTYLDYTGTPDGSMYGVTRDINLISSGNVSCKTRIPNLLLTGQNTILHGMLGTLAGSFVTCAEVLTTDEVFRQLKSIR